MKRIGIVSGFNSWGDMVDVQQNDCVPRRMRRGGLTYFGPTLHRGGEIFAV